MRVSASVGSEKGSKSASFHFSPTWLMVVKSKIGGRVGEERYRKKVVVVV